MSRLTTANQGQEKPEETKGSAVPPPEMVGAVDLGSNSFHMVIARLIDRNLDILDRIKEPVRLGAGLSAKGQLRRGAQDVALDCLRRFGQRLRDIEGRHVRAVGTNTLRLAKNAAEFLEAAREALGHEIEVVSGQEEARLIYLGVAHSVHDEGGRRLVIDIGGGSTECILGTGLEMIEGHSLYMGCVAWSERYFPGGAVDEKRMKQAVIAAMQEIESIYLHYRETGWDRCIGSSGTILSIAEILRGLGRSRDAIEREGLFLLRDLVVASRNVQHLRLEGLKDDRLPVFAGGLAILLAVFESFGLERMTPSTGALREGLLYDLLGRIRHEDVRDRTIGRMADRYHVDRAQAERVERSVLEFFDHAAPSWDIEPEWGRAILSWAARLHEIGLAVRYSGYHKHGAYLLENSDMPGFSSDEQKLLAALIRFHRRKFVADAFEHLGPGRRKRARRLSALLRLAVLLNRSRSPRPLPPISVSVEKKRILLGFPPSWLEEHALTMADLEEERGRFREAGLELIVV